MIAWLATFVLLAAGAASADDGLPAVARPALQVGEEVEERGLAFFVRGPGGPVAVGTAHAFDLRRLVEASRVDFSLIHSRVRVARSRALAAEPGRALQRARRQPGRRLPDLRPVGAPRRRASAGARDRDPPHSPRTRCTCSGHRPGAGSTSSASAGAWPT